MTSRHHVWPSVLIMTLLSALAGQAEDFGPPALTEQTLAAIQDCVDTSSPPWPQAWRLEYVDAIRQTLTASQDLSDCAWRLDILQRGFQAYWEGLKKDRTRARFEVQCAQIIWYTESLMAPDVPGEKDRHTLRRQWEGLWHEAAGALVSQFSFLDPNIVHRAAADHLEECFRRIETPLVPIFQRPFTDTQADRIREGWHAMRYARVDLMRQLGGEAVFTAGGRSEQASPSEHPHYLLAQGSLERLENFMWTVVVHPPESYLSALQNYREAEGRRRQRMFKARAQEERLASERSRQLHQTESLSFLLAVVLESARHFQSPSVNGAPDRSHALTEAAPPKEVMPMR